MQNMKKISLFSHGNKSMTSWRKCDVEKLEKCVLEFGTDFDLIAQMMGKTRDQIKRKFKAISKKDEGFGFMRK